MWEANLLPLRNAVELVFEPYFTNLLACDFVLLASLSLLFTQRGNSSTKYYNNIKKKYMLDFGSEIYMYT